ncbi:myomegalin-like [Aegotheles albertisi]
MANGYRTLSQHLNDLKKENFSLKLRIYFLEERVQQKGEDSRDDVYRRNIELKVEVESLKRELQEKQQALDNTWVAAENQTTRSQAALQQQYEEQQRESEHVYELLENKIQLLQEEARLARSEAEQATALARAEVERCRELAGKLKETARTKEEGRNDDGCCAMDQRRIEELTRELAASNRLVEALSAENRDLQQRLDQLPAVVGQLGPPGTGPALSLSLSLSPSLAMRQLRARASAATAHAPLSGGGSWYYKSRHAPGPPRVRRGPRRLPPS